MLDTVVNMIKECLPYFDEYRRVYKFSDKTEMTYEQYWDWRNKLKYKMKEYINQENFKRYCNSIAATELINDLLIGYAPSIAYSKTIKYK